MKWRKFHIVIMLGAAIIFILLETSCKTCKCPAYSDNAKPMTIHSSRG